MAHEIGEYVCPNGHEFASVVVVPCAVCDASVVCVPVAEVMRLHETLQAAEAEVARLRRRLAHA